MRYQDGVILQTQAAAERLFKTARAMPQEKLSWSPLDAGRTALDQLQECAQASLFFGAMLRDRAVPDFDAARFEEMRAARAGWTLDDCERAARENTEAFCAVVRDFPDDDLQKTLFIPFGGGMDSTYADIMMLHAWNMTYHWGQINYIQTLYGDREMH